MEYDRPMVSGLRIDDVRADRLHEGHCPFIWFEWSKHGWKGQWLHGDKLDGKSEYRIRTR